MFYSIWPIENKFDVCYSLKSDIKLLLWDLINIKGKYFLIKNNEPDGKEIQEKFTYIWNLFQPRTINFQIFFTNYRYTRYFKTFNLFVKENSKLEKINLPEVKKAKTTKLKSNYISFYKNYENYNKFISMWDENIKFVNKNFFNDYVPWKWQNLLVFPNFWSINCFLENVKFKYNLINTSSSNLQKLKNFLWVKTWKIKNVITTHAWVFQDWNNLNSIFVFYPYKWYYKNQQNPRYYLPEVVKQIKFFYDAKEIYYVMP